MINHYLQKLQELGIKVESIDLTDFIIKNINFDKSFRTNSDITIFCTDENNEFLINIIYHFVQVENKLGLTFKTDSIYSEIEVENDYKEMIVANFIIKNWDKINFKMSD